MAKKDVAGLLPVDFFTRGYRISGYIDTRVKTVGDILNDQLTSYLELSNVYISRASAPGQIVVTYEIAQLRKDGLLFVIVPVEESRSKVGRSVSYFGKQRYQAWLALPTFEIDGHFLVTGRSGDFYAYLAKGVDAYIPILNGVARVTALPDITFGGEAFLVNRSAIDLFCLGEAL
jgi:hypothetical protein